MSQIQGLLSTIADQVAQVAAHETGASELLATQQEAQRIERDALQAELVVLAARRDAAKSEHVSTAQAMRDTSKLVADSKMLCQEGPAEIKLTEAQREASEAEAAGMTAALRSKSNQASEAKGALAGLQTQAEEASGYLAKRLEVAASVKATLKQQIATEREAASAAATQAKEEQGVLARRTEHLTRLLEAQKRLAGLEESNASLRAQMKAGKGMKGGAVDKPLRTPEEEAGMQAEWLEGLAQGGGDGKPRPRRRGNKKKR